jgi:anti-sigma factor RsiW
MNVNEMVCREVVEVITAYLEGTLSRADRCRFDAHLAECPHCTEYVAQMRNTIDRLGRLDETTLSHETRQGIIAAFRDWRP